MATVNKTPSGTWKAIVRRTGWPAQIKTFRLRRDAEDWARNTEDEIVRGLYVQRAQSERLTFAAAIRRYLAEVTPTKKPSTQLGDAVKAKQLASFFGKYSLAAITPELIGKFRDQRLGEGKRNDTVRLELALLSHLFNTAIREWNLGLMFNPAANVRKPSAGQGRSRRLNADEETRILAAASAHSNPMFGWIVRIALETGMRSSEITTLRRSQVDLQRRVVRLFDTKNKSTRTVPLNRAATSAFTAALAYPIRPLDTDLIFFGEPGRDGRRRPYAFSKQWLDTKKQLGIRDLRFHDLRHEAVSRLVEGGLTDQEVSAVSGHKSMQMLKRYTHLRAEDLVARLDGLVRPAK